MIKANESRGVWPVALTPFRADGRVDYDGYRHLLDWYEENGAAGIFAVCLSSELYQLEPEERTKLARITREHLGGRLPSAACAGLGRTLAEKLDSIREMRDTGIDTVVLPLCQVPGAERPDDRELTENILAILGEFPGLPFGIYECPVPFHRLISAEALGTLAHRAAGQLVFLKDTCCDAATIRRRLAACAGSGLAIYNANTTSCLDSLRDGGAGYSGTSANFLLPALAELCSVFELEPERAEELQRFLTALQRQVDFKYPRSAKRFLAMRGVKIGDYCRVGCAELTAEDNRILEFLNEYVTRAYAQKGGKGHEETADIHLDRTPGGNRHHRDSGVDSAARA